MNLQSLLNSFGIGFAGIDGVWWRPATEPFRLPIYLEQQLEQIGDAIFVLLDVIGELYGRDETVTALLDYKVPAHIRQWQGNGRILSVRPDFQLTTAVGGKLSLKATELEICPSAQGFAHAMQTAYGLQPDLVETVAQVLNGRSLLIVGTHQWSEFLWEQLAFCRALAQVGAKAQVLYDVPIGYIAEKVQVGEWWQPPLFGVMEKTADWDDDVLGRIRRYGFEPFWAGERGAKSEERGENLQPLTSNLPHWPQSVGDAVVFRFGYVECFTLEGLAYFEQWQTNGATLLNPPHFMWDSKVVLAALQLPTVRATLKPDVLPVLDRCIPETHLLTADSLPAFLPDKNTWIIKFAGFDGGNQAWGGRSLQIGRDHTAESWQKLLQTSSELPWPVVAQRLTPSIQLNIPYLDEKGTVYTLHNGTTRLRTFFFRENGRSAPCGSHLTVSPQTQVSESTTAVQTSVIFAD